MKSAVTHRVAGVLVGALVASVAGVVASPPASAVTSTITYTLTGASATMASPLGLDSQPCVDDATAGTYAYDTVRIKPSVTGAYTISEDLASTDGRLGIYTGTFDPAAQTTGCLAFIDENSSSPFAVSLTAGVVYTLVRSAGVTTGTGAYEFDVDGPGTLNEVASTTTTLTTSPNPSELSKSTTLRAVVAGGATPTGTVVFRDGSTVIGTRPLSGGVAQLTVSSLRVGTHTLSALYGGDATHDVSIGLRSHVVKYGPKPKVRFRVNDKSVFVGDLVTLTWRVKGAQKKTIKASGVWHGKRAKRGTVKFRIKKLGTNVFRLKARNVNGETKKILKVVAGRAPKEFVVRLSDDTVAAGDKVEVSAEKLDPNEPFQILLDDVVKPLFKGVATPKGLAKAMVTLDDDLDEGKHVLTLVGGTEERQGSVDVFVLAETKTLNVILAKSEVKVGKKQTVKITGLVEDEEVTLTFDGKTLVKGVADEDGAFVYQFPVGNATGVRTLVATGQLPGRTGSKTFTVLT